MMENPKIIRNCDDLPKKYDAAITKGAQVQFIATPCGSFDFQSMRHNPSSNQVCLFA